MKRKVVLLPVILMCMVVFFSCDETAEKKIKPGVLKNGVYTGPCVLNVAGNKFNGTTTLTVTVSGDSATGTAESEFETLGPKSSTLSATFLGDGDYLTTLVVDSYTLTGNSFVSEDNEIEGSVSGNIGTMPATLSYNLKGQGMDDGGGSNSMTVLINGNTVSNGGVYSYTLTSVEASEANKMFYIQITNSNKSNEAVYCEPLVCLENYSSESTEWISLFSTAYQDAYSADPGEIYPATQYWNHAFSFATNIANAYLVKGPFASRWRIAYYFYGGENQNYDFTVSVTIP